MLHERDILHYDIIWQQVPECFEELLVRDSSA